MTQELPRIGASTLCLAALELQSAPDVDTVLQRIIGAAVTTIGPCDFAGLAVDQHGRPRTLAASDPTALELDQLQFGVGRGPIVDALHGSEPMVSVPDLAYDIRWGRFGREAVDRGVSSMVSHRLSASSTPLGALTLYSSTPNGFTDDDHEHCIVLSVLASLALHGARYQDQANGLREALQSRDIIGQAKGILMERENLDDDAAFDRLRTSSQRQNVKLRDIAQRVVDTRHAHVKA